MQRRLAEQRPGLEVVVLDQVVGEAVAADDQCAVAPEVRRDRPVLVCTVCLRGLRCEGSSRQVYR